MSKKKKSYVGKGFSRRLMDAIKPRSVYAFAQLSGISEGLLHKYKTGASEPGLDKLKKIAIAAQVSIDWLAFGDQHFIAESSGTYNAKSKSHLIEQQDIEDLPVDVDHFEHGQQPVEKSMLNILVTKNWLLTVDTQPCDHDCADILQDKVASGSYWLEYDQQQFISQLQKDSQGNWSFKHSGDWVIVDKTTSLKFNGRVVNAVALSN